MNVRRWLRAASAVLLITFAGVIVLAARADEPHEFWSVAVPGVLTGIGTLGLAGITVWLADRERRRDDELRPADLDRNERLRREAIEAEGQRLRRAQAELVSAWVGSIAPFRRTSTLKLTVNFSNASKELVYDVLAIPVQVQGEGPSTGEVWRDAEPMGLLSYGEMPYAVLQVLPPGDWHVVVEAQMGGGVEIGFTDEAGACSAATRSAHAAPS